MGILMISRSRPAGYSAQGSVMVRLLTSGNPSAGDPLSNWCQVFVIAFFAVGNVGILQQYLRGPRASERAAAAGRYPRFCGGSMNSRLITVFSHCGSVTIRNLKGFKNAAAPEAAAALVGPRNSNVHTAGIT